MVHRAHLLLAVLAKQIITAGYTVLLKRATKSIDPLLFILARNVVATIFLVGLAQAAASRAGREFGWRGTDTAAFVALGVLRAYFAEYLLVLADMYGSPLLVSTWLNVEPVMVCVVAALAGVETFSPGVLGPRLSPGINPSAIKLAGLALAVSGSVLYVALDVTSGRSRNAAVAHAFMLLEVVGAAGLHTLEKIVMDRGYSALEIQAAGSIFATALMTLLAAPQFTASKLGALGVAANWGFVLYGGVGLSVVGATLNTFANKYAGPVFVASFRPLQIVVTALFVWEITVPVTAAAALVVPALWLVVYARRLETRDAPEPPSDAVRRLRSAQAERRALDHEISTLVTTTFDPLLAQLTEVDAAADLAQSGGPGSDPGDFLLI